MVSTCEHMQSLRANEHEYVNSKTCVRACAPVHSFVHASVRACLEVERDLNITF